MEIINLGAADGLPPVNWAIVAENLDTGSAPAPEAHNSRTKWLVTLNEDGSPHITAVGAIWVDGTFGSRQAPERRNTTTSTSIPAARSPSRFATRMLSLRA